MLKHLDVFNCACLIFKKILIKGKHDLMVHSNNAGHSLPKEHFIPTFQCHVMCHLIEENLKMIVFESLYIFNICNATEYSG